MTPTTTLERPARRVDPLADAISDVEGLPETTAAAVTTPVVTTAERVDLPGRVEEPTAQRVTSQQVWAEVGKASFAIISHVTSAGEPRSSGVVYAEERHHLFVAVAPDGWKARQIADGQQVAVTIPVRRGGPLSLLFPIPPARSISRLCRRSSCRSSRRIGAQRRCSSWSRRTPS